MTLPAYDLIKQRSDECEKVCNDFRYFLDAFCWIEHKELKIPIPFKLWPSQVGILKAFLTALRLIILKARQLGLTWLTAAYCLWLAITQPLQLIVVISAKEDWAIEFLDRVKFILDRLPVWMYPKITKRTGEILEFEHEGHLFSTIKSLPTTVEGAQSKTPTLLILDETARNRYLKQIWAASKPGIDAAKGRIILISNSIKDGVGWAWTRDLYTNSMKGLNDFVRIFMPWWDRPGRSTEKVYDEETKGYIPEFIKQQRDEGMDEDDVSQHYPATEQEAISAMLGSYFGKTLAKYHPQDGTKGNLEKQVSETEELTFLPNRKGIIEIWEYPEANWDQRYAIGSDVSEGLGQTYSVAYVYDRIKNKFAARMRSNRIEADIWADKLIELAKYYNSAYIGVERNGPGITTIQHLEQKYPSYLFFRKVPGKLKGQYVKEYGWQETNANKHILAADLKTFLRDKFSEMPCSILLDECSTFIRHENGKLEHEEGKLDDCVIGAAITIQVSQWMPDFNYTVQKRMSEYDRRIERLKKKAQDPYYQEAMLISDLTDRDIGLHDYDFGREGEYVDYGEQSQDDGEMVETIR